MNMNMNEVSKGNHLEQMYIDGMKFSPKSIDKKIKSTFKERHTKITTYVENNLHIIIQILREDGQIDSITQLINDSLKYYLMEKFNELEKGN